MHSEPQVGGALARADAVAKRLVRLEVNGAGYELAIEPRRSLLEVLRADLGLTGTKEVCLLGACGACTVLVAGRPVLACLTLAVACEGKPIVTIEGVADGHALHPLQRAFVEKGAVQCGFCTPGVIMTAKALLDGNTDPSDHEIGRAHV